MRLLLALVWVLIGSRWADAASKVDLYDSQSRAALPWSAAAEPVWIKDRNGAERFLTRISISVPGQVTAFQARATAFRKSESSASKLVMVTDALSDGVQVSFAGGKTQGFQFSLKVTDSQMMVVDCAKHGIGFKPAPGQGAPPFYIGVKCVEKGEMIQVWIGTPRNVRWIDTSLAEFQGKGAFTRGFEINANTKTEQNKAGDFVFQDQNNKKYAFALTLENLSSKKKTATSFISVGLVALGFTSGSHSSSGVKPQVGVGRESRALSQRIPIGAFIESSFPSIDSTFVKLSGISLYSGYTYQFGKFSLEPRLHFILEDGSAKVGNIFVNSIILAGGAAFTYDLGHGQLLGEARLSFGSASLLGLRVTYATLRADESGELGLNWGIFLGLTQYSVSGASPVSVSAPALGFTQYF